ncbi:hypothetical protein P4J09_25485 [Bacillus cereus]|nr:hypothetical protein [Bacillus cereus]
MSIYEQGPDGKWGMRLLPVRGSVHQKFILVTAPTTINATEPCFGVTLFNTGTTSVTVSVLGESFNLDAGEVYEGIFDKPFTSVSLTGTSSIKGELRK